MTSHSLKSLLSSTSLHALLRRGLVTDALRTVSTRLSLGKDDDSFASTVVSQRHRLPSVIAVGSDSQDEREAIGAAVQRLATDDLPMDDNRTANTKTPLLAALHSPASPTEHCPQPFRVPTTIHSTGPPSLSPATGNLPAPPSVWRSISAAVLIDLFCGLAVRWLAPPSGGAGLGTNAAADRSRGIANAADIIAQLCTRSTIPMAAREALTQRVAGLYAANRQRPSAQVDARAMGPADCLPVEVGEALLSILEDPCTGLECQVLSGGNSNHMYTIATSADDDPSESAPYRSFWTAFAEKHLQGRPLPHSPSSQTCKTSEDSTAVRAPIVLRINGADSSACCDRQRELAIASALAQETTTYGSGLVLPIAPQVVGVFAWGRCEELITGAVGGTARTWHEPVPASPATNRTPIIARIAAALARMHALDPSMVLGTPPPPSSHDPLSTTGPRAGRQPTLRSMQLMLRLCTAYLPDSGHHKERKESDKDHFFAAIRSEIRALEVALGERDVRFETIPDTTDSMSTDKAQPLPSASPALPAVDGGAINGVSGRWVVQSTNAPPHHGSPHGAQRAATEAGASTHTTHLSPVVLAHNDMNSGNFLMRPVDGTDDVHLYLLDFEYGAVTARAFDLGNTINELDYDFGGLGGFVKPLSNGAVPAALRRPTDLPTAERWAPAAVPRMAAALIAFVTSPAAATGGEVPIKGTTTGDAATADGSTTAADFHSEQTIGRHIAENFLRPYGAAIDASARDGVRDTVPHLAAEALIGMLCSHLFWGLWGVVMGCSGGRSRLARHYTALVPVASSPTAGAPQAAEAALVVGAVADRIAQAGSVRDAVVPAAFSPLCAAVTEDLTNGGGFAGLESSTPTASTSPFSMGASGLDYVGYAECRFCEYVALKDLLLSRPDLAPLLQHSHTTKVTKRLHTF